MITLNEFNALIKDNQVLASVMGLYGVGVLTFLIRNIPEKIYKILKRYLTTSITITSQNSIFHDTMRWFEKEFKNKNFRTIKLSNGKFGHGDKVVKSIGYGTHWCFYKKQPLLIELIKDEGNKTEYDKDTLVITKLGRKHGLFTELIKGFKSIEKDCSKVEVYKLDEKSWVYAKDQPKRFMDSIFIEDQKKKELLERLDNFKNNEEWYKGNGIPYQLGVLLYGQAGTGKSSLIKVIASYLDYPIYYLDSSSISNIEYAVSSLPEKSLLVIEDIDSNSVTHQRKEEKENKDATIESANLLKDMMKASLSSILNSLDGIFSSHGRILIATTNHIEKLDNALIRPGRIDVKLEVNYINEEILTQFMNRFFPKYILNYRGVNIKNNITIAQLQNMVLGKSKAEEIFEFAINKV